jgi:O-antigen/teichoic acid export membrane protein
MQANIAATVLTLGALAAGWGITGIVAVRLLQTAVVATWTSGALRSVLHRYAPRPRRNPKLERTMIRFAAGSSFSVILMLVVYQRSELFFLNHFSSDAEIAHYAIASSALTILLAAPQALGIALAPALSNLHGAGQVERIRAGFSKAVRISLLGALVMVGLAAIAGPPLLVLVYGTAYDGVQTVFVILLPSLLAVPLISASSAVLIAHENVRSPLLAVAAAAAVDLGVAYALIPGHGAVGAAVASVSALAVAACLQFAFAVRVLGVVDVDTSRLLRSAAVSGVATLAGLAVLYLVPGWIEILAAPTAYLVVVAALAPALRIAAAEDALWLADLAGGAHPRLGRMVAFVLRP